MRGKSREPGLEIVQKPHYDHERSRFLFQHKGTLEAIFGLWYSDICRAELPACPS